MDRYGPILRGEHRHYRSMVYQDYLRRIACHAPGGRLLDVGCAHGFFLAEARRRGYVVVGVEAHPDMAGFARGALRLDVVEGLWSDVEPASKLFEVITFNDSLEYMPDPVAALRKAAARLARGGRRIRQGAERRLLQAAPCGGATARAGRGHGRGIRSLDARRALHDVHAPAHHPRRTAEAAGYGHPSARAFPPLASRGRGLAGVGSSHLARAAGAAAAPDPAGAGTGRARPPPGQSLLAVAVRDRAGGERVGEPRRPFPATPARSTCARGAA